MWGNGSSGRHRPAAVAAVVMVAVLALSACTIGADEAKGPHAPIDSNPVSEMIKPKLVASVKDGEVGVSPALPVSVNVTDGRLGKVTLFTPDNTPVAAQPGPDGRSWATTEPLGYNRTYRLEVHARGLGGAMVSTLKFTTSAPGNLTKPYLNPGDNEVVGVAQPVAIQFDESIPDRLAAQKAIEVKTEPPVEGAFYWLSNREVRWRPETFWAPGTKVSVKVNVYGRDLGAGLFGTEDISTQFTIGDAQIFTADDNTHQVTVTRNGQVVRTMPTSMGKDSTPTLNGVYIVADKHDKIIMDSSTYGVAVNSPDGYRTPVDYATRISYSGIFFHSAPWSLGQQGNSNASHGCLNLSPDNALWVLNNAKKGDPTIIKNTVGGTLSGTDGLGDWNVPWSVWKAGNANAQ